MGGNKLLFSGDRIGDKVSKLRSSWEYFGTAMMLSKGWEKYVVEKYRFRMGLKRVVPEFPQSEEMTRLPSLPKWKKPIRICYLLHYFFPDKQGGTERFVLNIAKEQQAIGNEVCVITLGKRLLDKYSYQTQHIFWEKFSFEGIPVIQMRYKHAPRGLYYDQICSDDCEMRAFAEEFISNYRPDIIHFAYPQPFATFYRVCVEKKIPYLITLTDFNIFCHYATMVKKDGNFCAGSCSGMNCVDCKTYGVKDSQQRYLAAKEMLQGAAYITVPSSFVANVMKQEFSDFNFCVVPHGIANIFSLQKLRKSTRRFLYVGTLAPLKGVHILVDAFQQLKGNISLEIYGSGSKAYVDELKRKAKKDSRISFYSAVAAEEMPKIYQMADCVIVPSIWYETYNFVLREALACGCLGIASKIGAMPEVISEGENGFLFEPGNVKSLVDTLKKALVFNWESYSVSNLPSLDIESQAYQAMYFQAIDRNKNMQRKVL